MFSRNSLWGWVTIVLMFRQIVVGSVVGGFAEISWCDRGGKESCNSRTHKETENEGKVVGVVGEIFCDAGCQQATPSATDDGT